MDELFTVFNMANEIVEDGLWEDFLAFSQEIDKVKEEKGLSEQEATLYVMSYWETPNLKEG